MNSKKTGSMTGAEFRAMVSQDPVYQAKVAEREARHRLEDQADRKAEKPLVKDLAQAGVAVDSVWDIIYHSPKAAIPILLKHLPKAYPDKVREGIARALVVPEAREGWSILIAEFEKDSDTMSDVTKGAIGSAISAAARDDDLKEVARLVRDKRHGATRITLLNVFEGSKSPLAETVLNEMLDDEDCRVEARAVLNRQIRNAKRRLKRKRKKEQS